MRSTRTRFASLIGAAGLLAIAAPAMAQSVPTFSKDVAPILFRSCVSCHRAGEMGPMPLTSFQAARPWARAIASAVEGRVMPPWTADHGSERFANDPRLSESEIATIVSWATSGAPEGDPRDLPAVPTFADGWHMGTPDAVFTMNASVEVPAAGPALYRDVPVPTTFGKDMYVRAAEVRPGVRRVTHHANVFVEEESGRERIASYSPGAGGKFYPAGVAKFIPKDTVLNLDMHYNPAGEPAVDRATTIGFVFAKEPVRQLAYTANVNAPGIDIAPGVENYEAVGRPFVFSEDSHILTVMPRMNMRGKDVRYTLVYPDGTSRVLLNISRWNYNWVITYTFAQPVAAPKGSRLEVVGHFDNSSANPFNPDPTVRVSGGREIMQGYFEYTLDGQDLSR